MSMSSHEIAARTLRRMGFKVVHVGKTNANGPDLWCLDRQGRAVSVEVKTTRLLREGVWQVPPCDTAGKTCNLIAIVFPKYVLVEPMEDHLRACSPQGYRGLSRLVP
jgi:hypothetical protein